jgi:hypothetical protein
MHKKDIIIIILVVGILSLIVFVWSVYFRPPAPSGQSNEPVTNEPITREERKVFLKTVPPGGKILTEQERQQRKEFIKEEPAVEIPDGEIEINNLESL